MRVSYLMKNLLIAILGFWLLVSMSSCTTNLKKLVYLQGSFDTAKLSVVNPVEPIIRRGDILSIVVYSNNPEATKIYNQYVITAANNSVIATTGVIQGVGGSAPASPGYQVDQDGNIVFQGIGKLHVEGLNQSSFKRYAGCKTDALPAKSLLQHSVFKLYIYHVRRTYSSRYNNHSRRKNKPAGRYCTGRRPDFFWK